MADVENQQEPPLPVKRKPDLYCQDQDNVANKAQKLQPSNSAAPESKDGEKFGSDLEILDSSAIEKIETEPVVSPEKTAGSQAEIDESGGGGDPGAEEEQEEEDGEEEEEERREAEVDRKGKGILRDDKGKGKLIEEDDSDDEDDDDDDDDDDADDEDDGSDLSDDPLAEVDLDNILPSRTRRRAMQPGLYISDEIGNHDDDDDSDDSDA